MIEEIKNEEDHNAALSEVSKLMLDDPEPDSIRGRQLSALANLIRIYESKWLKAKEEEKPEITGVIRDKEGKFVKGCSGNPEGRPEGAFSLLSILKAELQNCPKGEDEKTYAQYIVEKMLQDAKEKGDDNKLKLIWNYIEGMPRQSIEHTGKDEGPIQVNIINYKNAGKDEKTSPPDETVGALKKYLM